ncbi:methyltransferase domain-containing protein [Micromonospora sp. STR1s_5]|nr:methyltransferase domain-containing protein [Micromonospora sp. STR1s_5]
MPAWSKGKLPPSLRKIAERGIRHGLARARAIVPATSYERQREQNEARIQFGIAEAIAYADHQGERVAALEGAWRQHIPDFLNAVASVEAFARQLVTLRQEVHTRLDGTSAERLENVEASIRALWERVEFVRHEINGRIDGLHIATRLDNGDASIRSLWERIEFVRREILFELSHRGPAAADDRGSKPVRRILSPDKVEAARKQGALRLNLGCGHIRLADSINVDMRELPGVDVLADVGDLPFEGGSVDEIASSHLLEHFPQERLRRQLLPHWFNLLRPGGTFRAITPDSATMLAEAGSGRYSFEEFREAVFGAQDYVGDYHYNLFTPDSLRDLLEEAGFSGIEIPVAGRRNGKCFEFEITAVRP